MNNAFGILLVINYRDILLCHMHYISYFVDELKEYFRAVHSPFCDQFIKLIFGEKFEFSAYLIRHCIDFCGHNRNWVLIDY